MKIAHLIGACCGAAAMLIAAEVLLQVLPVSTATQMGHHTADFMRTYAPNRSFRASAEWDLKHPQEMWSNNYGFATHTDFKANANAVAMIGDSFVEGSALDEPKRLAPQLQSLLNDRPVYAMAVPGSSLIDYGQRLQWAYETLGIRDFVLVLEQGDVSQSICKHEDTYLRCIDPKTLTVTPLGRSPTSSVRQWLAYSALAQYFAGQLRLSAQAIKSALFPPRAEAQAPETAPEAATDAERAVVSEFLERYRRHADARLILIVDCDRRTLYRGLQPKNKPGIEALLEQARSRGITALETCNTFAAHFQGTGARTEVSNKDSHWNMAGNRLVAELIANAMSAQSSTITTNTNSK